MQIAQLVLDYIKALVWPTVLVIALIVLRTTLPDLVKRMKSLKLPGGTEAHFTEVTAIAETLTEVRASVEKDRGVEPGASRRRGRDQSEASPSVEIKLPDGTFTPGRSPSKTLRQLRFDLVGLTDVVKQAYGLSNYSDFGVILDIPPDAVDEELRELVPVTKLKGWAAVADAVASIHTFSRQPMDADLEATTVAILAQHAYDTARSLTLHSLATAPAVTSPATQASD